MTGTQSIESDPKNKITQNHPIENKINHKIDIKNLAAIESYFQAYLLNKDPLSIQQYVVDGNSLMSPRLNIYFEAYRMRLIEILQKDYPKLQLFLGKEKFLKYALDYIGAYPSTYFSVRYFGQFFSQFLKEIEPCLPALAELAELEWKFKDILDAAEDAAESY